MTSETKKRITDINNGIIPEGYKKTKVGIVPVEWETTSLGNYIVEHTEKSTENNQYPVLTSSRRGIFLQSDYYNKQVASEDNTGYNVVPFGYFTYRHMSDDEIFRFNINNIVEKGIVSTLYPVFTTHNLDDNWLLNTLNNGHEFQKYALIQKQGGSRTYMYLEKLKKLKLAIPPLPEQQKIAEILSTQDKLIELQEKKIKQLKELKKAYLQKMFPKKGSKYPELRFKGFTNPWEQRKLGDVAKFRQGIQVDLENQYTENADGRIRFIRIVDYTQSTDDIRYIDEVESANHVDSDDVVVVRYGATAGFVGHGITGIIANNMFTINPSDSVNKGFLYTFMKQEKMYESLNSSNGSSAMPAINFGIMTNIEISYPTIEEQIQIGDYFIKLDNLITLHQRKLDEEKQKKKALMQLLLTGKVRVKL